ncbi:hypothetical protein FRC04_006342 [Tulasnella sp. 424]|nr:hypothetical protein FRC04_006342 [Tulasnella sp. 424]KAG8980394.1 hypothetical protein FRC05_006025 [Tulasnella sp. 425]
MSCPRISPGKFSTQSGVFHLIKSPLKTGLRIPSPGSPMLLDRFEFDTPYRLVPGPQPKSFLDLTPLAVPSTATGDDHNAEAESRSAREYTFPYTASAPGNLQGGTESWPSYYNPQIYYRRRGPVHLHEPTPQVTPIPPPTLTAESLVAGRLRAVCEWAEEKLWVDGPMASRHADFKALTMSRRSVLVSASMIESPSRRTINFCEWLADTVWNELRGGYVLKNGERITEEALPPSYRRQNEDLARCYARLQYFASTWLSYHLPKKYREYNLARVFDIRALPLGIATIRELIYGRGQAYTDFDHYPDISALRLIAYLVAIHFTPERRRNEGYGPTTPHVGMDELFGCGLLQQVLGMSIKQIATGAQIIRWAMPDPPEEGIEDTSPWTEPRAQDDGAAGKRKADLEQSSAPQNPPSSSPDPDTSLSKKKGKRKLEYDEDLGPPLLPSSSSNIGSQGHATGFHLPQV